MKHLAAIVLALVVFGNLTLAEELDFQSVSLQKHNELRRLHVNTPDMVQDAELNKLAQKCSDFYVQQGNAFIPHSCPYKDGAGENIHWEGNIGGHTDNSTVASRAAKGFHDEHKDYNWDKPGATKGTLHFTQLVWVQSTKLGSGHSVAKNGTMESHYFVNLYLEAGNYNTPESFRANVQKFKPV